MAVRRVPCRAARVWCVYVFLFNHLLTNFPHLPRHRPAVTLALGLPRVLPGGPRHVRPRLPSVLPGACRGASWGLPPRRTGP